MTKRRCDGCGQPLTGRRRRWCGDKCRSRARRVEPQTQPPNPVANAVANAVEAPTDFGPNRQAVEELVRELEERELVSRLEGARLTAARELASQVDADPGSSPLWGRFQHALESLEGDAQRAGDEVQRETMWSIKTGCRVPEHAHGPDLAHCGTCCRQKVGHVGLGRWVYHEDGSPTVWIPSDEEILARAASGEPIVLGAS